jgi:hypothetical protein
MIHHALHLKVLLHREHIELEAPVRVRFMVNHGEDHAQNIVHPLGVPNLR